MSATATRTAHATVRTELTRYTVPSAGERILYGLRTVHGEAILIDMSADDDGRVYLVERGLEQDGNAALQALILDYLQQSAIHDEIPAARYLQHRP